MIIGGKRYVCPRTDAFEKKLLPMFLSACEARGEIENCFVLGCVNAKFNLIVILSIALKALV